MTEIEAKALALVNRLREVGRDGMWKSGRDPATAHPMCIEAADLIETQAREIERLRGELSGISGKLKKGKTGELTNG
ncbi:MAG: hypothetical protein KG075_17110 [Alphaproteobacteria bacterium]|nr:hypothetical protein [Alphaproteobacteria bacterium]